MRWAVIAVTKKGACLSDKICECLINYGECTQYTYKKYALKSHCAFDSIFELTEEIFYDYNGLLFISACGIAVRSISKMVRAKTTDPAVLVVDEQGKFVISLLSGHIGKANEFSQIIADYICAVPVITTATDIGKLFSPDSFAAANSLLISEMDEAKRVAADILNGKNVGFYSEYPFINMPKELTYVKDEKKNSQINTGISVSGSKEKMPFVHTLHLIPENLVLGVGCKKNYPPGRFEKIILEILDKNHILQSRLCGVATIDLKKDEAAIICFCKRYNLPLYTFTADELLKVSGEFAHSDFVEKTTGVGNVCERSGMALAKDGKLIVRKQAFDGITAAIVEKNITLDFLKKISGCAV